MAGHSKSDIDVLMTQLEAAIADTQPAYSLFRSRLMESQILSAAERRIA
jgi:hypothetical protein